MINLTILAFWWQLSDIVGSTLLIWWKRQHPEDSKDRGQVMITFSERGEVEVVAILCSKPVAPEIKHTVSGRQ